MYNPFLSIQEKRLIITIQWQTAWFLRSYLIRNNVVFSLCCLQKTVIWQIYPAKGKGHISMPLTDLPCSNMGKICSKKLITIVGCNFQVSEYPQWFINSFITDSVERICPKTWKISWFRVYTICETHFWEGQTYQESLQHSRSLQKIHILRTLFMRKTPWSNHQHCIYSMSCECGRSYFDGTDQQQCNFREIGTISKQVLHKNLHDMQIITILGRIISSSGSTIFFHISS